MTSFMVRRLIAKDWRFNRGLIGFYIAAGVIALAMIRFGEKIVFYTGGILLISALIGLGIHLTIATVVEERKRKTLPFVMSLPVSFMEYTTAKIMANLLVFLGPWLTLVAGTFVVILGREAIPNGLTPFAVILLLEIFVGYTLILAVALITESEAWTIGAIVATNIFFNLFLFYVSNRPGLAADMKGPTAVWGAEALGIMAVELAAIAVILGLTFFFQSRKKDFL